MITGCLSDFDLDRLHAREASPDETADFLAHLDACPLCAQRDARLVEEQEHLVSQLRGLPLNEITFEASSVSGLSHPAGSTLTRVGGSSSGDTPRQDPTSPSAAPSDAIALTIKGVRIVREIQRGGQGVVYEGLQEWPRRRVAVKVLRDSMLATRQEIYRIEQEIEVLGRLHHPGIVAIHFSGTCDAGRYYVMDYIEGEPLDAWMAEPRRNPTSKLKTFIAVCDAVHAAHLQGVIHRDLKPANILIDDKGHPHVLDFGLAKIAQSDQLSRRGVTNTGVFLGTLAWASPEQLRNTGGGSDLRSDVYALGVLLYHALVGVFPYDVSGSMPETIHHILNTDPARPRSVAMPVDDEIQAILFKCLDKNPTQRYQSAGELAADLRRHIAGEPVEAKRHSTLYTLKKIARRHKAVVSLAAMLLVALVGSVSFMAWSLKTISDERRQVVDARHVAERHLEDAVIQRERAEQRADDLTRSLYDQNIRAADNNLTLGRIGLMKKYLEACPDHLRDWEWQRLTNLSDESRSTLIAGTPYERILAGRGQLVLIPTSDRIFICDAASFETQRVILFEHSDLTICTVSSDGRRLAALFDFGGDGEFRVYDPQTGTLLHSLKTHQLSSLSLSEDGSVLAFLQDRPGRPQELIVCHEMPEGEYECATHQPATGGLNLVSVSPDGEELVCLRTNGTSVYILDSRSADLKRNVDLSEPNLKLLALPDGRIACFGAGSSWVKRVDPRDSGKTMAYRVPRSIFIRPWEERVSSVAVSPDLSTLAAGDIRGNIYLWDYETGRFRRAMRGHRGPVVQMSFVNSKSLLSSAQDGEVRFWHLDDQPATSPLGGSERPLQAIGSARFLRGGRRFMTCAAFPHYQGGEVTIWSRDDTVTPLKQWTLEYPPTVAIPSPDEKVMVVVGFGPDVYLYDMETEVQIGCLKGHGKGIPCADFAPDGRTFLTASWDGTLRVWSRQSHEGLFTISHDDELWEACYSPDGRLIAAGSRNGMVLLVDALAGEIKATLRAGSRPIDALAFSPDGRTLATGGFDQCISIWNLSTFEQIHEMQTESGNVYSAVYTPDGGRLITGSSRSIEVWDPARGKLVYAMDTEIGSVYSLDLSPSTQALLASGLAEHAWLMDVGQRTRIVRFPF